MTETEYYSRRNHFAFLRMFSVVLIVNLLGIGTSKASPASPPADGKAVYDNQCAMCHGPTLQGGAGPTLVTPAIQSADPEDLATLIRSTMPLNAPGSLPAPDYKAVVDYILGKNSRR